MQPPPLWSDLIRQFTSESDAAGRRAVATVRTATAAEATIFFGTGLINLKRSSVEFLVGNAWVRFAEEMGDKGHKQAR